MDTKDAYIKQLENTILSLQKQVDNLTEMILLLRKEKFGSSSEKTPKSQIDGQLSLFNEAELEVSSECDEPMRFIPFVPIRLFSNICRKKENGKWTELLGKR